jgi:hypothetical protein
LKYEATNEAIGVFLALAFWVVVAVVAGLVMSLVEIANVFVGEIFAFLTPARRLALAVTLVSAPLKNDAASEVMIVVFGVVLLVVVSWLLWWMVACF